MPAAQKAVCAREAVASELTEPHCPVRGGRADVRAEAGTAAQPPEVVDLPGVESQHAAAASAHFGD